MTFQPLRAKVQVVSRPQQIFQVPESRGVSVNVVALRNTGIHSTSNKDWPPARRQYRIAAASIQRQFVDIRWWVTVVAVAYSASQQSTNAVAVKDAVIVRTGIAKRDLNFQPQPLHQRCGDLRRF